MGRHHQAQRVRTRAIEHFKRVLTDAHCIATPTMPIVAPAASPAALRGGESNVTMTVQLMTYMLPANFTGLPGITVPVGLCPATGLPVGLQLMGRYWQEATLLRAAAVLEGRLERLPRPPHAVDAFVGTVG